MHLIIREHKFFLSTSGIVIKTDLKKLRINFNKYVKNEYCIDATL